MNKYIPLLFIICMGMFYRQMAPAQANPSAVDKTINFPTSFLNKIENKCSDPEDCLTGQTEKYLRRLAERDKKMKWELVKSNPAKAEQLFGNVDEEYNKGTFI